MKKHKIALAVASLFMTASYASEFDGAYVGVKVGGNRSDITAASKKSAISGGAEAGYNWNYNSMILGVDGFMNINDSKTHVGVAPAPGLVPYWSRVYGLDLKLGLPNGNWMPYAKLGYAQTQGRGVTYANFSGSGVHPGLGVEYKFGPQWSAVAEVTHNSGESGGKKLNNDNFLLGLNYYFNKPYVAPEPVQAPAPAPAPVVTKAAPRSVEIKKEEPKPEPVEIKMEEPKAAPAPAPKEAWKVIMEEKPVRIEGANFDTASAKLKPTAGAKLQQVVDFAAKYKEANLEVSGHTDNVGNDKYNLNLSEKRAASVKAYLVKKGIAASRITAKGYGKTQPAADNKTKEGRASNRRVEVRYTIREEKRVRVQ